MSEYYDCDRNVCASNEINGIGCKDCVCKITEEPLTDYEQGKADTIKAVLEIIDKAQKYKMAVGSTDLFIDREAFRDEVLALKGEQG